MCLGGEWMGVCESVTGVCVGGAKKDKARLLE